MRQIQSLMDLSGRKALVTGGAGHIGLAVAETLLELGSQVTILDLDEEACRERVAALAQQEKNSVFGVTCNLSSEDQTRAAIQKSIVLMDGLDILIHCAAYVGTTDVPGWAEPFEKQSVPAWDTALKVGLTSAFTMVQEGRKALASSGHGTVIFLGSIYGLVGPDMGLYEGTDMQNPAGYSAAKGGLLQLTRYLATVLAPDVRVNAISPGGVWRDQPDAFHKRYVARTPMGRMATEEDLKGAVAYLASDLSAYATGQNLSVDGGWTAW